MSSNNVYLSIYNIISKSAHTRICMYTSIDSHEMQLEFSDRGVNECFHRTLKVSIETTQLGIVLINVRGFPLASPLHPTQTRELKSTREYDNGA